MRTIGRTFAVLVIYAITSVAWLVLGSVMTHRTVRQEAELTTKVNDLWGRPLVQRAPRFELLAPEGATSAGEVPPVSRQPDATRALVDLRMDQRLKGLTWYSLYDVAFDGAWTYRHTGDQPGMLAVTFVLPDTQGVYDDFRFVVNGEAAPATPIQGAVHAAVPVDPGDVVEIEAGYKSRGLDTWAYEPAQGAATLHDFHLRMTTNFDAIDFPAMTLSPSARDAHGAGQVLHWDFAQVVSGYGIGMVMPQRTQPGELAADLAYSAPISLGFFFLVVAMLARLRAVDIHPVNYFFLGAAFFSFHLLLAYTVDHVSIGWAFALSSVTSVAMVVSYLRLVVSARFAIVEAGIAELVYLVGFGLAHFVSGFTGLTVAVLSIATLFLLMLVTGRVRWTEVLARPAPPPFVAPPAPHGGYYAYPPQTEWPVRAEAP